jgi:hypothetical protein
MGIFYFDDFIAVRRIAGRHVGEFNFNAGVLCGIAAIKSS